MLAFFVFNAILAPEVRSSLFMDIQKLKMKIGIHEFEAEGPVDIVQSQFAAFKELIAALPLNKPEQAAPALPVEGEKSADSLPHIPIEKIMKAEGRVVSLTARCESIDEAVLLILLGQKEFRANQEATGAEIMDGLVQSGYRIPRVDHQMNKLTADGSVITIGVHRGRRYRLTNLGLTKALEIAKEVVETVP
jgi:hypothetical protein